MPYRKDNWGWERPLPCRSFRSLPKSFSRGLTHQALLLTARTSQPVREELNARANIMTQPPFSIVGGDVAYFTLRVQDPRAPTSIFDIVACGMGQWGSLGNGMWNQWQGVPVRLKSVSGVVECESFIRLP
jgi:hypothetical protein